MLVIDTTGFKAMATQLAHMGAMPLAPVIRSLTGKVLEGAIDRTKWATQERIRIGTTRKFNNYSGGDFGQQNTRGKYPRISISPKAGNHWFLTPGKDGRPTFHLMSNRQPNALWAEYKREEADRKADLATQLPKAAASKGLSRSTWLQIAQSLNIPLRNIPGYVYSAVPANGRTYKNGSGVELKSADSFFIEIENSFPALLSDRLQGERILQRALNGMLRNFEINVSMGVFSDLKRRAQNYPGIFVLPG